MSEDNLQVLYVPKGLKFSRANILESLQADDLAPCRLEDIVQTVNYPPTQRWKKIEVHGNAFILDETIPLYRIVEQSVKKNQENYITAEVSHFLLSAITIYYAFIFQVTFEKNLIATNLQTTKNINNVNISNILDDALYDASSLIQVSELVKVKQIKVMA